MVLFKKEIFEDRLMNELSSALRFATNQLASHPGPGSGKTELRGVVPILEAAGEQKLILPVSEHTSYLHFLQAWGPVQPVRKLGVPLLRNSFLVSK